MGSLAPVPQDETAVVSSRGQMLALRLRQECPAITALRFSIYIRSDTPCVNEEHLSLQAPLSPPPPPISPLCGIGGFTPQKGDIRAEKGLVLQTDDARRKPVVDAYTHTKQHRTILMDDDHCVFTSMQQDSVDEQEDQL